MKDMRIVHFLQLLADVFSLSLMKLPTDVLQKVVERLADCQKEREKLIWSVWSLIPLPPTRSWFPRYYRCGVLQECPAPRVGCC